MARLSEKEWNAIQKRLLKGESAYAIAKDYPVTKQAIQKKFGCLTKSIKETANQILTAEVSLRQLPEVAQVAARNLADDLIAISSHIASGSRYGAMTFHRLSGIANQHAQKLDDDNPDPEAVLRIAQLTEVGNKSAAPSLNLLAANRKWTEKEKEGSFMAEMSEADYIKAIKEADERLQIGP